MMSDMDKYDLGKTVWFNKDLGRIEDPDVNCWHYSIVLLNKNKKLSDLDGVIAHEIGHVMGLRHRNTLPISIMCQKGYGRTAIVPSTTDIGCLSAKYKNRK